MPHSKKQKTAEPNRLSCQYVCLCFFQCSEFLFFHASYLQWFLFHNCNRCWLNHWSWSIYSSWNSCSRAFGTCSCSFLSYSRNSCCFFGPLLCRTCKSLPISWKCLPLFLHLCWRRVISECLLWKFFISVIFSSSCGSWFCMFLPFPWYGTHKLV